MALLLILQFSVVINAPGESIQFGHDISNQEPGIIQLQGVVVWSGPNPPRFQWAVNGPKGGAALSDKQTLRPKLVVSKPGRYVVQLVVTDGRIMKNAAATMVVAKGKTKRQTF